MHVQGVGYGLLNRIEKLPKFFASMSAIDLTDDSSCFYVQSSKQRRRAMPGVVMTTAFPLDRAAWEAPAAIDPTPGSEIFRRRTTPRPCGWIQIQPHDVSNFLDE